MKLNNIVISVIVPIYNVKDYIEKCLNSILNQTYKNLEIILVDDGSTDGSEMICDMYSKKDNRIIVIHHDNQGVSVARNIGIKKAKGDYIGFVDPDDYIENNMFEILLDDVITSYCDIATCGVRNINYETKKIEKQDDESLENVIVNKKEFLKKLLDNKDMPSSVWNKLFSRKIIDGIEFDPNMKIGEDFKWLFHIIEKNESMCVYIDHTNCYNWQRRNVSAIQGKKYNIDMKKNIDIRYEIIKYTQKEIPDMYDYAVKNCLLTNLAALEQCNDYCDRKHLRNSIKNLKNIFLKSKVIKKKEKIKFFLRYRFKIVYNNLKKIKWKVMYKKSGKRRRNENNTI